MNNPLKILLIEDDKDFALVMTKHLEKINPTKFILYKKELLSDGMKILEEEEIDTVLLDLHLPDSKGATTYKKLLTSFPKVPVVITTSLEDENMAIKAAKEGVQDYLVKGTYSSDSLCRCISYSIERHNLKYQLKRYMSELEQFAYAATHNIKVPIVNIENYFELLKQEIYQNLSEENKDIDEYVYWIDKSIKQANGTIIEFVEAAKIVKDQNEDGLDEIDINEQLKAALGVLEADIKDTNAEIITDFSSTAPIKFSKLHANSILYNLISNAIKYRSPERSPQIFLQTKNIGKYTCLTIKDNGLGLDLKNDKEKLFSMFQRAHTHVEGTGMGLYLVKKSVETHNGKIEVESKLGEGTTFKVYFKN